MTTALNSVQVSLQINAANTASKLLGKLHFDTVMQVHAAGQTYIEQHHACLFDLSDVSSCDSAALALLLDWLRFARHQGKSIQFINLPKQLLAIAKAVGIEKILFSGSL